MANWNDMIQRQAELNGKLAVAGSDPEALNRLLAASKKESFGVAASAAVPHDGPVQVATMLRLGMDQGAHPNDRIVRYDSIYAFLAACEGPVTWKVADGKGGHVDLNFSQPDEMVRLNPARYAGLVEHSHPLGIGWEGFTREHTFEQAKAFWYGGWPEGVEKMRQALTRVEAPVTEDIRRRGAWSDLGSELSTDRLYAGAWDNAWRTTKKRRVTAPTRVRIVVDMGSSCGKCNHVAHDMQIVTPDTLFWRGAAAANLAESLEAAGFAVEVVVAAAVNWANQFNGYLAVNGSYTPENTGILATGVTVKGFGEPLDIASLTSVVSSSTFFRRAFIMWELVHAPYMVEQDYGNLLRVECEPRVCDELGLLEENVATVFVSDWVLTPELANAWARGTHAGLESVNNPEAAQEEMEGAS